MAYLSQQLASAEYWKIWVSPPVAPLDASTARTPRAKAPSSPCSWPIGRVAHAPVSSTRDISTTTSGPSAGVGSHIIPPVLVPVPVVPAAELELLLLLLPEPTAVAVDMRRRMLCNNGCVCVRTGGVAREQKREGGGEGMLVRTYKCVPSVGVCNLKRRMHQHKGNYY
jgi:hypothetical protein